MAPETPNKPLRFLYSGHCRGKVELHVALLVMIGSPPWLIKGNKHMRDTPL